MYFTDGQDKDQNRINHIGILLAALKGQADNGLSMQDGYCDWGLLHWDNTRYQSQDLEAIVGADGTVDMIGHTASMPTGIRPAIQLKFEDAAIADSIKYIGVVDSTGKVSEGKKQHTA